MRLATVGATLGLAGTLTIVGTALNSDDGDTFETVSDRPSLPLGSPTPGYEGAEDTAIQLASTLRAVDAAPGESCPEDELAVTWEDTSSDFETGATYAPVGPRPRGNESSNGIVYCQGHDYDFTGFNATWDGARWSADLAPDFGDDGEPVEIVPPPSGGGGSHTDDEAPDEPSSSPADEVRDATDLQVTDDWKGIFDGIPIEPLPEYEPQTLCDPSPKAGTYGFSELVQEAFPFTSSSGISRACDVGARSEHKEGRAWDWSAAVDDPQDARAASEVIGWLLATDEHGNEYAMARRLGLMYIIYNRSIWRAYAPEQGWLGYTGPNPHTDHVHFSFSRDGGLGETSFWEVEDLPDVSDVGFGPYAVLPSAGGLPSTFSVPDTTVRTLIPTAGPGHHQGGGSRPTPSGGGTSGNPTTDTPDDPSQPAPFPPTTLPLPLPTLPLPGGDSGGGGAGVDGLLPDCPPGTPLLPLPLDCLLPDDPRR